MGRLRAEGLAVMLRLATGILLLLLAEPAVCFWPPTSLPYLPLPEPGQCPLKAMRISSRSHEFATMEVPSEASKFLLGQFIQKHESVAARGRDETEEEQLSPQPSESTEGGLTAGGETPEHHNLFSRFLLKVPKKHKNKRKTDYDIQLLGRFHSSPEEMEGWEKECCESGSDGEGGNAIEPERVEAANSGEVWRKSFEALGRGFQNNLLLTLGLYPINDELQIDEKGERPGMVMPYIENMKDLFEITWQKEHEWTNEEGSALSLSICTAIRFALDHDICLIDIKPENVLGDMEKRLFLVFDFDLAQMDSAVPRGNTFAYTPPEYCGREHLDDPDGKYDLYSTGLTLSEVMRPSRSHVAFGAIGFHMKTAVPIGTRTLHFLSIARVVPPLLLPGKDDKKTSDRLWFSEHVGCCCFPCHSDIWHILSLLCTCVCVCVWVTWQALQENDVAARLQSFFVVATIGDRRFRADIDTAMEHLRPKDKKPEWEQLLRADVEKFLLPYSESLVKDNMKWIEAHILPTLRKWQEPVKYFPKIFKNTYNISQADLDIFIDYIQQRILQVQASLGKSSLYNFIWTLPEEAELTKKFLAVVHAFHFLFPDFLPYLSIDHLTALRDGLGRPPLDEVLVGLEKDHALKHVREILETMKSVRRGKRDAQLYESAQDYASMFPCVQHSLAELHAGRGGCCTRRLRVRRAQRSRLCRYLE